jgi:uncharacterized protein
MARIHSIYRYPIKGLSPEPLARTTLTPGETVPGDRLYAIENGPSGFDPQMRRYLAKTHFLMLMKNERLANLRTSFNHQTHTLTIETPTPPSPFKSEGESSSQSISSPWKGEVGVRSMPGGGQSLRGDLRTADGRAAIEQYFAAYCADELRGPPKILHAQGHSFSDVAKKVVSIINLNSVAAIEDMVGAPVNPLRFRANVYVEGWPAWSELDLVGKELTITPRLPSPLAGEVGDPRLDRGAPGEGSAVRLKIVKRIVRCAATNVDPATGIRDLELPQTIMRKFGHADCGIYAEVIEGGEIAAGDAIAIL